MLDPIIAAVILVSGTALLACGGPGVENTPSMTPRSTRTQTDHVTASHAATSSPTPAVPSPPRTASALSVAASPSSTPTLSWYDELRWALARYFPPPYSGRPPDCGTYRHLDIEVGYDEKGLRTFDKEARRLGTDVWSPSAPYVWIGSRETALEAFRAIEVLTFEDGGTWLILYDPDWLDGTHYARDLRRFTTPGGNTVWYLKDTTVEYPGECPEADGVPGGTP